MVLEMVILLTHEVGKKVIIGKRNLRMTLRQKLKRNMAMLFTLL